MQGLLEDEAEIHAVNEHATDVVLSLLQRSAAERSVEDEASEPWPESETHEGCNLFGCAPSLVRPQPKSPPAQLPVHC